VALHSMHLSSCSQMALHSLLHSLCALQEVEGKPFTSLVAAGGQLLEKWVTSQLFGATCLVIITY
jgi:hypothetical protein